MRTEFTVGVMILMAGLSASAQELRTPIAPIAPTDRRQCDVLEASWRPILKQLEDIDWKCSQKFVMKEWVREDGVWAPRPCLPVARQAASAYRQSRAQIEACWAQVDAHKKQERDREREQADQAAAAKKAEQERQDRAKQMQREYEQMQNSFAESQRQRVEETRRAVEEQQRAAAEAERQRHDASQRAVNDAMRDMFTSRDRAQEYNAKAAAAGSARNVPLTSRDLQSLDAIRNQAEANNLRPRYVSAEPSAPMVSDSSALVGAVADLLGPEVQDMVKWGLNRTQAGAALVDTWEAAEAYNAQLESLAASAQYIRAAANGTTTYDQDVAAINREMGRLSGFAFSGNPAISIQLGRVIGGVSAGHQAGFQQLELLFASVNQPMTASEISQISDPRRMVHAIFGPFLPLDRMHRLERVVYEGGRVRDSYNRGFFEVFGR